MEFDASKMDEAAAAAEAEMKAMSQHVTVPMARWFQKHYMKAGHKRLGRILVQFAKNMKETTSKDWADVDDINT